MVSDLIGVFFYKGTEESDTDLTVECDTFHEVGEIYYRDFDKNLEVYTWTAPDVLGIYVKDIVLYSSSQITGQSSNYDLDF